MPRIHSTPNIERIAILDNERYDQYHESPTGKMMTLYYANWTIYGRNFPPSKLPIDYIPEIAYAFFDVSSKGDITSLDAYADFEKRFTTPEEGVKPLDNWSTEEDFYGCFGQFLKLKRQGKKFNLLLSLGGWSKSKYFSSAVLEENRSNFVSNLINIFEKYPIFCGVSLDWEYITDDGQNYGNAGNEARPEDADNFRLFVQLLRSRLDREGKSQYKITVPCSANPEMAKKMKLQQLHPYIDVFDLMHYDFSDGNWGETTTAHHTNMRKSTYSRFSVEESTEAYLAEGVPPNKIMVGVAFYSRGFSNSSGPGTSASGGSADMSWEKGVVDYKDLPKPGATEYWDSECMAPFSFDPSRKIYNSYDNVNSVYEKCKYVWDKKLKGCLVWEASGDLSQDNPRCLTKALYKYLIENDPRTLPPPVLPPLFSNQSPPVPSVPVTPPKPDTPNAPVSPDLDGNLWGINKNYIKNQIVEYKNKIYICIQPHTSNSNWAPDTTQDILWKLKGAVPEPPKEEPPKEEPPKEEPPKEEPPKEEPPKEEPPKEEPPKEEPQEKKIKNVKFVIDVNISDIKITYE